MVEIKFDALTPFNFYERSANVVCTIDFLRYLHELLVEMETRRGKNEIDNNMGSSFTIILSVIFPRQPSPFSPSNPAIGRHREYSLVITAMTSRVESRPWQFLDLCFKPTS